MNQWSLPLKATKFTWVAAEATFTFCHDPPDAVDETAPAPEPPPPQATEATSNSITGTIASALTENTVEPPAKA
jgi:hypothetical protein